jgi:dTDP-glucose 4,6-dehydratase
MDDYLADDFARIGAGPIEGCLKVEGTRLYLSGATGFFGMNILSLLSYMHRRGARFRVTALSRSPGRFFRQQPWVQQLSWLDWQTGNVLDPWPGDGAYDHLLHAATDTTPESQRDSLNLFDQIMQGTRRALEFAADHGVRNLLLCGSGAQYGAIPGEFASGVPESALIACDPIKPSSTYGEGKRASELLATLHAEKHGFNVVAARCFAFVGPGLRLDGHFAIGNFIRDALNGSAIRLAANGAAMRSYLYGADLAVWLLRLLFEAKGVDAVNVGSDRGVSIIDLATRVRDVVNPTAMVVAGTVETSGERRWYVPGIAKARSMGFDAWTDLGRSIARTADWHRGRGADANRRGSA